MATRQKTPSNGSGANGNGANGNGAHGNGANGANGNGAVATAEARRIATEIGSALLVASRLETARHSDDVELIAGTICERLGLPGPEREDILAGARLHDIGKASIPRELLDKPTALSPTEWELMRTHTTVGQEILGTLPELEGIARLVRHSHERWDGGGYPDGLAADEIPLGSRIIFCADAFHAIRSDRPYRRGVSAAQALGEIRRCAGTQFDPDVVATFEEVIRDLRLVPKATRTGKRSARLTALLLCLAVGGGGSAIAGTDLLGEPDAGAAVPPPVVLNCGSLYCYSLTPTVAASAGTAAGAAKGGPLHKAITPDGPLAGTPGAPPPGTPAFGHPGSVESRPIGEGPRGGEGDTGGSDLGGDDGGKGDDLGGGDPEPAGTPPKPDKDKDPDANGNDSGHGHGNGHGGDDEHGHGHGGGKPDREDDSGDSGGSSGSGHGGSGGDGGDGGDGGHEGSGGSGGSGSSGSSGSSGHGNSGNSPGHNKPPKS
jgi:hypothetical protein